MSKLFPKKDSSGTFSTIPGRIRGFIPFPRVFDRDWNTNSLSTIAQFIALTITPRGHNKIIIIKGELK